MSTATRTPSSALAGLRTPAQRLAAAAVVLGLVVLMAALVTGNQAQHRAWDDLPTCETSAARGDCVLARDGRFVVRSQDDQERVYFYPEDGSGRDRVNVAERHLRGGAKATSSALYVGDDVIGVQDRDGERHYRTGALDVPGWYLLGFAGAFALIFGGGFGLVAASRRR